MIWENIKEFGVLLFAMIFIAIFFFLLNDAENKSAKMNNYAEFSTQSQPMIIEQQEKIIYEKEKIIRRLEKEQAKLEIKIKLLQMQAEQ